MPKEFKLPELGENISSGNVSKVLVRVGDTISVDQPVLEMETDKAVIEVPSSVAGTVTAVNVQEGKSISVGAVVLLVSDSGAKASAAAPTPAAPAPIAPTRPAPAPSAPAARKWSLRRRPRLRRRRRQRRPASRWSCKLPQPKRPYGRNCRTRRAPTPVPFPPRPPFAAWPARLVWISRK